MVSQRCVCRAGTCEFLAERRALSGLCTNHPQTGMFKPNASSTSASFGCFDPRCFCGGSSCTCNNNQCGYSIRYRELADSWADCLLNKLAQPLPAHMGTGFAGSIRLDCCAPLLPLPMLPAVEGSSTSGYLTEDVLAVGDGGPGAKFVFGCTQYESGLVYAQRADGVFGMGRTPASLQGQVRPGATTYSVIRRAPA